MRTLVLGGYGHFGGIIARSLARDERFSVVIAGRDANKAQSLAAAIGADSACMDAASPELAQSIMRTHAELVISAAGPFQGQDYSVARAAIASHAHYIDIADGRAFVCGISTLDSLARAADVLTVSGASSVPALSSAVVERKAREFASLLEIETGISASATVPGEATLASVLGYCGRPFAQWRAGRWIEVHGCQELRRHVFHKPRMSRWLANCDVPDLALFPPRYSTVRSVSFVAGVELLPVQLGVWILSWAARAHMIRPDRHVALLGRAARALTHFGSGESAMFVRLRGLDSSRREHVLIWELRATGDDGLNVPCMAAVALSRKLAAGKITMRGAMPCLGLVSLDEYLEELAPWQIEAHEYTSLA